MIKVYTETVCERCGHIEKVEGDHRLIVPERWALLSISYWEDKTWREDNKVALCPACAKAAETFMKPTNKPEKPARKPRSDKGVKKALGSPGKTDTAVNPPASEISRQSDYKPTLEIHGPDGRGMFTAEINGSGTEGTNLQAVVYALLKDFGGKWPDDMSDEDKKMGNDLIEGKKPE